MSEFDETRSFSPDEVADATTPDPAQGESTTEDPAGADADVQADQLDSADDGTAAADAEQLRDEQIQADNAAL